MMIKFLREHVAAAGLLTLLRLYLGYKWVTAGWGKVTDGFDATGFMKGAVSKASGEHPAVQSWWAHFLDSFALPNAGLFNVLIPCGELLVGTALLLGCFTSFAACMGLVMNYAFLLSGSISANPQMILFSVLVLVAAANAGKFGADYYVLPYLKRLARTSRTKVKAHA